MRSRWKQLQPIEPNCEYLAFASRIPPKSRRATWRLFRGSRAVGAQMAATEGAVGFSLLARPFRMEYATISLWVDEDALAAFARSGSHAEQMHGLTRDMGDTVFVRWTIQGREGVPSWDDALARIAASSARDGQGSATTP